MGVAQPEIVSHRLEDGPVSVTVLSYGAIVQDWRIAHKGTAVPVVLGYANPVDYLNDDKFLGIVPGRVANRIGGSQFVLDGETYHLTANDGPHQLHGGQGGLGRQHWHLQPDGARAVRLTLHSPDGAEGYPGSVEFSVRISLDGYALTYEMEAHVDRPTPINLTQHCYFNLNGGGTIADHEVCIPASGYTPVDDEMIPTGEIASIDGQAFDMRVPRTISEANGAGDGFDVNLVLDADTKTIAQVRANGLVLGMSSDTPGLQFYTGQHLRGDGVPHNGVPRDGGLHDGQSMVPFGGLCLEPQGFPDAPNHANFLSIIVTPDAPYRHKMTIEIAPDHIGGGTA